MLNSVALCGRISEAGPKLFYRENAPPECRWTLVIEEVCKGDQIFRLFVPCVAYS
jgi:hypothetical protein